MLALARSFLDTLRASPALEEPSFPGSSLTAPLHACITPSVPFLAGLTLLSGWKCWSGVMWELLLAFRRSSLSAFFKVFWSTPLKGSLVQCQQGEKWVVGRLCVESSAGPVGHNDLCFNSLLPCLVFYKCIVSSGSGAVSSFSCGGGPWTLVIAPAPDVLGGWHGACGAVLVFGELEEL